MTRWNLNWENEGGLDANRTLGFKCEKGRQVPITMVMCVQRRPACQIECVMPKGSLKLWVIASFVVVVVSLSGLGGGGNFCQEMPYWGTAEFGFLCFHLSGDAILFHWLLPWRSSTERWVISQLASAKLLDQHRGFTDGQRRLVQRSESRGGERGTKTKR